MCWLGKALIIYMLKMWLVFLVLFSTAYILAEWRWKNGQMAMAKRRNRKRVNTMQDPR